MYKNYESVTRYRTADGHIFDRAEQADNHIEEIIHSEFARILKLYAATDGAQKNGFSATCIISLTEFLYEQRDNIYSKLDLEHQYVVSQNDEL